MYTEFTWRQQAEIHAVVYKLVYVCKYFNVEEAGMRKETG